MNWIKITPETELPDECDMLLAYQWAGDWYYEEGYTVKGLFEATPGKTLDQFSHYCLITPPEE